ncbi:MAG TPA: response regulator transcription factor [Flavisolibacter sp.]|jgi:DNA-binding NarL/FixJ family response regulator|nr:response regulator transcription factor [Flavisolibacter sp.]
MSVIKLAIIDDHEVIINGLKAMLSAYSHFSIIYTANNANDLLSLLKNEQPDVLLMDIQMPEMNGVELCKHVHKQYPAIKIIAFSSFDDSHYVKQIIRNGASGYLLKNAEQQSIITAIEKVVTGEEVIDEAIKKILIGESITGHRRSIFDIPLTNREKEILKLIAGELTNQEIADQLFISLRTVETHRFNLTQKLGAKNTASLVKEAMKRGLME